MDFTLERLLCGTQRSEKVKPFPSTRATLSFSEKTISVNTGVIHEKNEIKSTKRRDNSHFNQ
jgi:hypothetical protein